MAEPLRVCLTDILANRFLTEFSKVIICFKNRFSDLFFLIKRFRKYRWREDAYYSVRTN